MCPGFHTRRAPAVLPYTAAMTFKTLEDIQDKAKMKDALKGLRRLRRPAPFLFKARCEALGGDPLLLVSGPGRRLSATVVRAVRLGTLSIRGTVCREDSRLVFTTTANVNKPQMAKLISRVGAQNGANLPLTRIEIRTPKDAKAPAEKAATPPRKEKPKEKPKKAKLSPRERARRLRERAPAAPPAPEPTAAPALDLSALEADLADWRAQLAEREALAAAAEAKVEAARVHLERLGAAVQALSAERDLPALAAGLRALVQLDDDPELPALAARAEKARDVSEMQERVSEWFEDISEEHGWEIESLREAATERQQAADEMAQLVASVEQVIAQG